MNFTAAITTCFQKYIEFGGRARRPEYWYWVLFNFLVLIVTNLVDLTIFGHSGIFSTIVSLGLFLPSLAVAMRRLHDTDRWDGGY